MARLLGMQPQNGTKHNLNCKVLNDVHITTGFPDIEANVDMLTDFCMDRLMYGQTDVWTDLCMDRQTLIINT